MTTRRQPPSQWAYFYQLVQPIDEATLAILGELLAEENSLTRHRSNWSARLVIERGTARILVVCDSPSQDRKVNRRIEAHLRRLKTAFSVTVPLAIGDDITPISRMRPDPD